MSHSDCDILLEVEGHTQLEVECGTCSWEVHKVNTETIRHCGCIRTVTDKQELQITMQQGITRYTKGCTFWNQLGKEDINKCKCQIHSNNTNHWGFQLQQKNRKDGIAGCQSPFRPIPNQTMALHMEVQAHYQQTRKFSVVKGILLEAHSRGARPLIDVSKCPAVVAECVHAMRARFVVPCLIHSIHVACQESHSLSR